MLQRDTTTQGRGGNWTPRSVGDTFSKAGYCGSSFNSGLVRFHDEASGTEVSTLAGDAFGSVARYVGFFAFDWLGRQIGLIDAEYGQAGMPETLIFDIGAGEIRGVGSLEEFVERLSDGTIKQLLSEDALVTWKEANPGRTISFTECVGLIHPLFLGGQATLENLEICDISVYWTVMGGVYQKTRDLPDSTVIGEVRGRQY